MENLISYILQVIMKSDVKVKRIIVADVPVWHFLCEGKMLFIFDKEDIQAFRDVYNSCKMFLSAEEIESYKRFFSLCV